LRESPYGDAWFDARKRNYLGARGYETIAELGAWTVVYSPRTAETVALSKAGELLSLVFGRKRAQSEAGGSVYRVQEEFHLEISNREAIAAIQGALRSEGTYPLMTLVALLGIEDRMTHIEALRDGLLQYDRSLAHEWASFAISVRMRYGVFVPDELAPYVKVR